MRFTPTALPGVTLVEPDVLGDPRGWFFEVVHAQKFAAAGLPECFVQDNHSGSTAGVVRGLHAQLRRPQGKLVRVLEGAILDVAVDIRRGSPTFAQSVVVPLSAADRRMLYVPPGYAHGFCVTEGPAQMEYKCTDFWDPGDELTVAWNDPQIAIAWPVADPILSAKDRAGLPLAQLLDRLPVYPADRVP